MEMTDYQKMLDGIQQYTAAECQSSEDLFQHLQTQKRTLKKSVVKVKSEINSTFSRVMDSVKNREAFLVKCVDDHAKTVSESIARMGQQLSRDGRHEFAAAAEVKLVDIPQLTFAADEYSAVQQVIGKFGKVELSSDPRAVLSLTASCHHQLQREKLDMETWTDENEDDFIVLTDENETSLSQDEDTRSADVIVMDQYQDDVEKLQRNPIADVIEKVMLDSDGAWLSSDVDSDGTWLSSDVLEADCDTVMEDLKNDLMPGWCHVEDGTFKRMASAEHYPVDFKLTIPITSSEYWLVSADERFGTSMEMPRGNSGPSAETISRSVIAMDVSEPKTSLAHWLLSTSCEPRVSDGSAVSDTAAEISNQQNNGQDLRSCEKFNARSKFNSTCRFSFEGDSCRLEELPGTRSSLIRDDFQTTRSDTSFGNAGTESLEREAGIVDDGQTSRHDSLDVEGVIHRLFARITAQPPDSWLMPRRAVTPRHSLPLNYWLSPPSASGQLECSSHELANLRVADADLAVNVTSADQASCVADNFATFVRKVLADSSSDWLSVSSSILKPSLYTKFAMSVPSVMQTVS